ncbi:MAG: hypothetical protein E6Q42_11335 [Dechloromonas sp.]|nr:MAG: hypothetical protein E6Q42_11335 [Dechloromonas sp.]
MAIPNPSALSVSSGLRQEFHKVSSFIDFSASVLQIRTALARNGWCYLADFSKGEGDESIIALAHALGHIYIPPCLSSAYPLISTKVAADTEDSAPFNQQKSIGWHSDFSSHVERPAFSLAYLIQADTFGGAWRVASTEDILLALQATPNGASLMRLLLESEFPYSFSLEDAPIFFRPLEPCTSGRLGLRFYGRALRNGAQLAYGSVPLYIERAIAAIEFAADLVGHTFHAPSGALLVVDNWHALHDRLESSLGVGVPPRRSLLCFVSSLHKSEFCFVNGGN